MTKALPMTINEFFGWKNHPFSDLADQYDDTLVRHDQEVLKRAVELLKSGKSLAVTGGSGLGKTTLTRAIIKNLDSRNFQIMWVPYSGANRNGILRMLAEKTGVELTRKGLPPLAKLQKHIAVGRKDHGAPFPIIVVDDAQHLEKESLMDLCAMLVNPEDNASIMAIILVGDETLDRTLRLSSQKAISSRLACVFRMKTLAHEDAKAMLISRIEKAKAPTNLFDREAMELITANCGGNRRELMKLAFNLCMEAHMRNERVITAEMIMSTEYMQTNG
jgi:type II secretory pathway predicted ATPase ExeA